VTGALANWPFKAATVAIADAHGQARPRHIAIIMDGNGRWAKAKGLPRSLGHKAGVDSLRKTVEAAGDLGIEVLTVYAFSTENWRRPDDEIDALFGLLRGFIRSDLDRLDKSGVRIRILGQREGVPPDIIALFESAEAQTADNTVMTLVIAFNYGGQVEIADAVQRIAEKIVTGALVPSDVTPQLINEHLLSYEWPDPDLVIRTSGEQRLSNFLIWQSAYAEFLVVDTLWPDFGRLDLEAALNQYALRQRRYGGVTA
jgi:undecaprenyl diphosphate synthase